MQIPSPSSKASLGKLAEKYHEALLKDEVTLSYLASRAIDLDAVRGFLLGVVTDPDPMHQRFAGFLSIPYITPTGIVKFKFRCPHDHNCKQEGHPKYDGPSEEARLYNVPALHLAGGTVGITEGELDALVGSSGLPCVGVPGATSWKSHWSRLFEDYDRVYILGDGDDAGRSFVKKLLPLVPNSIGRPMPDGMDVNLFIVQEGTEAFLAYLG